MSKWPKEPRDYDSYIINTCHGNPGKTQKLLLYKKALELACKEISRIYKEPYDGDSDFRRFKFISQAIEEMKNKRQDSEEK